MDEYDLYIYYIYNTLTSPLPICEEVRNSIIVYKYEHKPSQSELVGSKA